jgi:hypothetical protein
MFLAIEQLKERIKTFTILEAIAGATQNKTDIAAARNLLDAINETRLQLGVAAELGEIFYDQVDIPAAANANTVQNQWYSRNDQSFMIKRGIANLAQSVQVSLLNQGERQKVITREQVAWQQLFSGTQIGNGLFGQQVPFDLPEALRFRTNQALNIGVQGQTTAGYVFFHGQTQKANITDATVNGLRSEFINDEGQTVYLPETQVVPMQFQFPEGVENEYAVDPSGNEEIYTIKNDRSVLLTRVSVTSQNFRINKLIDIGRNQEICDRIEVVGVASFAENLYTTYYDLPYPHLLRRGNRLKGVFQNLSIITGDYVPADTPVYIAFEGITL